MEHNQKTMRNVLNPLFYSRSLTTLPAEAHGLYLNLLGDQYANLCGVMKWTPARIALRNPGMTPEDVTENVRLLEERGFVILDEEAKKLWVRHRFQLDDELHNDIEKVGRFNEQLDSIGSPFITEGLRIELERLRAEHPEWECWKHLDWKRLYRRGETALLHPQWGQWDAVDWRQMENDLDGE